VDIAAALKQYGFVGQLANSNPELRRILTRAAAGNWSPDEFSRAVQDSNWWRNSADAIKQYDILRVTKPGEFRAQRDQLVNKVRTIAAEMGVYVGEGSKSELAHLVNMAQMHGWDEATLRQQIGHQLKGATATFGGQAGEIQQQIRQLYYDMGVPYSSYTVNLSVRHVLEGRGTVQGVQANVAAAAKSRFPALAAQIDAGQTVRQIADPYIQAKAQLLEVPPDTVTLQDATVKKALNWMDTGTGHHALMPLWQYEQQVKADPKWDRTKNARDDYSAMAHQIGRDWGFVG
jgi:hypothetical protein